jgi:hypothetical protein
MGGLIERTVDARKGAEAWGDTKCV